MGQIVRRQGVGPGAFVGKTIADISSALEHTVFTQEHARLPGLLQGLEPRAKTAALALLLLTVGLAQHLTIVVALYLASLALARSSLLPLGFFVKRVWLGVPLFAGLVALPALFLVPGRPLLVLAQFGGLALSITDNSLASFVLFVARVGTSVSVAMLLVLTTPWSDLLRALRSLGLPGSMVVVLGMTYRYLFTVLHLANDLFLARASRTVGVVSGAEGRRWAARSVGVLMGKSLKVSGDVHLAMQARGFAGEVRALPGSRLRDEDWLVIGLAVAMMAGLLLLDRGLT